MSWDFFNHSERKAAKSHTCEQCRKTIDQGEQHAYCAGKFDGYFISYREHLDCRAAWKEFSKFALEDDDSAPFLADADGDAAGRAEIATNFPAVAARLGWVPEVNTAHKFQNTEA